MKDQDPAIVSSLHRELNELFDGEGESLLHALVHIRNAVLNLRADVRTEKFMKEIVERDFALHREKSKETMIELYEALQKSYGSLRPAHESNESWLDSNEALRKYFEEYRRLKPEG